jgi:tetratricopeptide (TPR) repeat protein
MAFPDYSDNRHNEATDRTIKRLQARVAKGDDHLRTELAEALLRAAQESAVGEKFDIALKRIDEALKIIRQLVEEGEFELNIFVGRALLFRAAVTRFHKGPEASVNAFNEAIRHFVDMSDDTAAQHELAVALMSKADILIDPLGAYATALAVQEQAAKIWQRLLNRGNPEFRQSLIGALMACSDSKLQNGDPESAIIDLKNATEIAEEGVEDGETAIQPLFIQTLLKLARLYDQENNIDKAFETIRSAIRTVKKLIEGGIDQARMMYTTLHLHQGMLYEKIRDSASALAEFDRCRDVYVEIFRDQHWGVAESYAFRTGLANVLMCRGNMLADLGRYAEAEQSFEESVWQYQQADEKRPPEDQDETLVPYSIGVVQLNHANLLVIQGKIEEAIVLKEQAIAALKRRMEAGYDEIIPNFLAAYRKLIGIRQMQSELDQVFELMDDVIGTLEKVVDDGKLEFRFDLALSYRQRAIQRDELRDLDAALEDSMRSLQIFRTIADDDRDISDVHLSKVQWSELLHQIAVIKVKQNENDEAFDFLQKEIDDLFHFYREGNGFAIIDLMLGYTQYFNFVETFGGHLEELKYPEEKFSLRVQNVQKCCRQGYVLSRQKQGEVAPDLIAKLFFMMKSAFFLKADGMLHRLLKNNESACQAFETSLEHWYALLGGLETLKAKDRYDAAEKGEPIPDWDIPGGANDPYQDRYIFYINELRETMQLAAKAYLACDRQAEAKDLFERENALTRELVQNGIANADRFLVVSLTSHARNLEEEYPAEKTMQLYDEALQVLKDRFQGGDVVSEDFWMLKRVCKDYLDFLREKSLLDDACRISSNTLVLLESVQTFPSPDIWKEVCTILEIFVILGSPSKEIQDVYKRYRKLLRKHPEFKTDKDLKSYDRQLKKRLDVAKDAGISEPQS